MSRKKITKNTTPKKTTGERDPIPWRQCLLTLICGLFLVIGFFGAARQHFSSIDFGIKNSKLRKQVDELEAEKRRMLLTKEVVLSPGEIKKSAKKIGFTEMSASNIEVFRNNPETQQKPPANKTANAKPVNKISNTDVIKKEPAALEKAAKKRDKLDDVKDKKDKSKTQLAKN
jgi:hypothetical protein